MSAFPTISGGRVCLYPAKRTASYATKVMSFVGDTEQRWITQKPVSSFQLTYTGINGRDMSVLRDFFNSQGGASTSEFTFSLDGITTYDHCVFVDDSFTATQSKINRFDVTIKFRQTRDS